jgi:hypothetical protein
MLKPLFLALLGCLGFTGCAAFTTSQTWQTVMRTRPDAHSTAEDPAAAYAAKLHHVLKAASVDHKVVTFDYHYTTRFDREDVVGTHTAVIYRDNLDPNNPWWLMEDRLSKPVWVTGSDPENQVSFYVSNYAHVVSEKDFPARGRDHKETVAIARSANGYQHAGASHPIRLRATPASDYYEIAAVLPQSAVQRDSYAALFRSVYGKAYNATSAADRRKMAMLQHNALRHRRPLASQTY